MSALAAVIYAKKLDRLVHFYRDLLGLRVVEARADDFACLQSADELLDLVVVAIPGRIAADITIESPPRARESTPIKLTFTVDDLEAARRIVPALGGTFDGGDSHWTWRGMTYCDGRDPEGNVFQLRTSSDSPGADPDALSALA